MITRCSSDAANSSVIHTQRQSSVRFQRQSSVRFATVSVRQFSYTLGDSPSTTCGPPTALSWSYSCPEQLNGISIDRYEALCHPQDQPRRSRRELKMSVERRRQILYDVCDDSDDENDDDDGTNRSNNEENNKITPKLIAKAERRVERRRLRLERNRAYATMTTYFPRRINTTGRSASFPPNKHSECDAILKLKSCGSKKECNIDLDQRKNARWDDLLSTLDTTPAYRKSAERKAELLREELCLSKTSAANSSTISSISQQQQQQQQQYGARALVVQHAVTKNNRASKQRSFNSRAA